MVLAALPGTHGIGFFLGVPLLASFSFGNEFRHRTLSLLLSQPVDRMKIWGEKLSAMLIALLPVILVCGLQAVDFWAHGGWEVWEVRNEAMAALVVMAGLWLVITVASAPFWTLLTRSMLGGLGLLLVQSVPFFIAFIFVMLASWKVSGIFQWFGIHIWAEYQWLFIVAFVFLCYAGVMLRLGRRELAQFQIMGVMTGDDLLMAGPNVMSEGLAGLFRCRPAEASLNLIRKELRLLRPLWLLTLLFALGEIGLRLTTWFIPYTGSEVGHLSRYTLTGLVLSLMLTVVIVLPVLAGSLSLGEERTSGRQLWHITQPVSARRQWLVKLVVAMFAGFVCAVVVVAGADQLLPGWPFKMAPTGSEMLLVFIMSLLLSYAAFWCACAVNGTVRAVLWVFPVLGALSLASRFGNWFGGLAAAGTLMDRVASSPATLVWLVVPTLLLAVIQSYRMFRTEPQDSIRSVIPHLMPLAIVAFLCGFSLRVFALR
jgi:ABC-type transport system involved in multi-copper enzyme maturation permease subunit